MADESQVESSAPVVKPAEKKRSYIVLKTISVCLIVALLSTIVAFHFIQKQFTYENLQGYWNISENTYLLISDTLIQIIQFNFDAPPTILFEDTNTNFKYKTRVAIGTHTYEMIKSNNLPFVIPGFSDNPFNDTTITFDVYPVIGAMQIKKSGEEIARLMKDNQMSVEYLSM